MGKPYSQDLRERVIAAVDSGTGAYVAAPLFRVSVSYIYKALIRLLRFRWPSAGLSGYSRHKLGSPTSARDSVAGGWASRHACVSTMICVAGRSITWDYSVKPQEPSFRSRRGRN